MLIYSSFCLCSYGSSFVSLLMCPIGFDTLPYFTSLEAISTGRNGECCVPHSLLRTCLPGAVYLIAIDNTQQQGFLKAYLMVAAFRSGCI